LSSSDDRSYFGVAMLFLLLEKDFEKLLKYSPVSFLAIIVCHGIPFVTLGELSLRSPHTVCCSRGSGFFCIFSLVCYGRIFNISPRSVVGAGFLSAWRCEARLGELSPPLTGLHLLRWVLRTFLCQSVFKRAIPSSHPSFTFLNPWLTIYLLVQSSAVSFSPH